MDNELRQRIEARIEQLTREREQYVAQANQQIGAYNGAIGELEALLNQKPEVKS